MQTLYIFLFALLEDLFFKGIVHITGHIKGEKVVTLCASVCTVVSRHLFPVSTFAIIT